MYRADGFFKMSELDVYEEGCIPNSGSCFASHEIFQSHSLDSLLETIVRYVGGERDCVELDACGEPGRVDVTVLENADGYPATKSQIDEWKSGRLNLWDSVYSFNVYEYQKQPVIFEEKTNA